MKQDLLKKILLIAAINLFVRKILKESEVNNLSLSLSLSLSDQILGPNRFTQF
jgi:hypothetical protein